MRKTILNVIANEAGQDVTEETPLDSLNLDSLEFVQMLIEIEGATGLRADDRAVSGAQTVGEMITGILGR